MLRRAGQALNGTQLRHATVHDDGLSWTAARYVAPAPCTATGMLVLTRGGAALWGKYRPSAGQDHNSRRHLLEWRCSGLLSKPLCLFAGGWRMPVMCPNLDHIKLKLQSYLDARSVVHGRPRWHTWTARPDRGWHELPPTRSRVPANGCTAAAVLLARPPRKHGASGGLAWGRAGMGPGQRMIRSLYPFASYTFCGGA